MSSNLLKSSNLELLYGFEIHIFALKCKHLRLLQMFMHSVSQHELTNERIALTYFIRSLVELLTSLTTLKCTQAERSSTDITHAQTSFPVLAYCKWIQI